METALVEAPPKEKLLDIVLDDVTQTYGFWEIKNKKWYSNVRYTTVQLAKDHEPGLAASGYIKEIRNYST